jgi:LytS/YehU family sensor histidine kinase
MLYITQRWFEQRDRVKNIEINQLQTELKYLRAQINPHFLFNGLNTIYSCIDMNNQQARDIVVQFSDLLRYNLYEADVDRIALIKEVEFLKNYVALQKARSNDNVSITLDVDYQHGELQVAPLIFISFVENTFKYISSRDDPSNFIHIALHEAGGRIDFKCKNTFDEAELSEPGIGLNNAVRRLELLYKNQYDLHIGREDGIYQIHLTLTA